MKKETALAFVTSLPFCRCPVRRRLHWNCRGDLASHRLLTDSWCFLFLAAFRFVMRLKRSIETSVSQSLMRSSVSRLWDDVFKWQQFLWPLSNPSCSSLEDCPSDNPIGGSHMTEVISDNLRCDRQQLCWRTVFPNVSLPDCNSTFSFCHPVGTNIVMRWKEVCSTQSSGDFHPTTRRHIPEDRPLYGHRSQNVRCTPHDLLMLYKEIQARWGKRLACARHCQVTSLEQSASS